MSYNPGGIVLSAIQQSFLVNLEYSQLRVPSCMTLATSVRSTMCHHSSGGHNPSARTALVSETLRFTMIMRTQCHGIMGKPGASVVALAVQEEAVAAGPHSSASSAHVRKRGSLRL